MQPRVTQEDILRALQLGGSHLAAGRVEHAGAAAVAILKAEPKNPDALHLLGLVALAKGDAENAEKLIASAAALMPRHVNVWVNLGNAQRDQGKVEEALISYRRAEALNPAYADIFLNRGQLYQETSQYAEAIADFERLMEVSPDEPGPYMRAASAATDAGRFRDVLTYCQRALDKLDEVPAQLKAIIATTHERIGELDKAVEWSELALTDNPKNGAALRTWSKARRRQRKNDAELLTELRRRLEEIDFSNASASEARLIYSELAQLCDEQSDVESAFGYFTKMNSRTKELPELKRVDQRKFIDEVNLLNDLFSGQFVESWTALPEIGLEPGHAAVPVFLVGFPRSGTTLLDQILDAHPAVQVFEELPFLGKVKKSIAGYPHSLAGMSETERANARKVYWDALRKEGADLEGKMIVDKMPLDLVHSGLIARVFPEAKIIFALRHPADCVLSCFMQDFVPNASMLNFLTLDGSAALYDSVMNLWETYRKTLSLNVHEVRYENLVADLRGEVEPALNFLDLPWDSAVNDPAAHALARGTIRTPSYSQVTQPIYSSSTERWRRYEAQMRPVLPVLQPHVERFGYSL
ncbi:tetratricopeptide repeat-containing sulfotransferase family protein [Parvibaculum lavamentivorans]|uniref:tetratricopeptide repeat-containing sulfotransferase family protein n=1 Tax=Parvibaculum lavamentivorans TaxID=256618 RepID=UPI00059F0400|nr:tetratricopeptide repeat-containing sulfotransferase family protein [Parvibaculum lavamentivorans]